MNPSVLTTLVGKAIETLIRPKEEKPKEDKKEEAPKPEPEKKRAGGVIKSSASKRADGCATRGKTRGRMV